MIPMHKLLGCAAMTLALAGGLSAPAMAQKLDNKNTAPAAASGGAIDFGDDSGQWANDGECDDPRFSGEGSADETLEEDIRKDATDCATAYEAGTVVLSGTGTSPLDIDVPSIASAINFGDDSGEWANDGECDDPRFEGTGSAAELVDADIRKDATDCRAAFEAGTVTLVDSSAADTLEDAADAAGSDAINYGDDTSEWAKDDECDDPRFKGTGVAAELLDADRGHDATDCRAAVEAGTATFVGENAGTDTPAVTTPAVFDYGADWSKWSNDGECDDPRFVGEGTDKKLLNDDAMGDATDCKALEAEGKVSIRKVFTPEYAAGAPYDSSAIDFGDNTSSYADDDQCDDPRFEGPGLALTVFDSDLLHDAEDCKAAFEAGTVALIEGGPDASEE